MKCTIIKNHVLIAGATILCTCGLQKSTGATANVDVGPASNFFSFSPAVVNIHTGDKVVWTWKSTPHTTTSGNIGSADGLWNSGSLALGLSFTNTFNSAGNFPYYCQFHTLQNMTGEVIVAGSALPPVVMITNPPDGITLSSPASFTLAATASATGGSVTNVQFFQDTSSLGNVTSSPYSLPVSGLGAGDYAFSAVAADSNGLQATNSITVHVVTPVAIVLSMPQLVSPSDFRFEYTANPGLRYVVQRSSDLSVWTSIQTNVAGASPETFDDTNMQGNTSFYRVGLLPNP